MIDDETRAIIAGMKRARIPTKDIAKRFGLSTATVGRVCAKSGAKTCLIKGYKTTMHRNCVFQSGKVPNNIEALQDQE